LTTNYGEKKLGPPNYIGLDSLREKRILAVEKGGGISSKGKQETPFSRGRAGTLRGGGMDSGLSVLLGTASSSTLQGRIAFWKSSAEDE